MPSTPGSLRGWNDGAMKTSGKLLSVNDLTVHFDTDEGIVEAVNDVQPGYPPGRDKSDWWENPVPARP